MDPHTFRSLAPTSSVLRSLFLADLYPLIVVHASCWLFKSCAKRRSLQHSLRRSTITAVHQYVNSSLSLGAPEHEMHANCYYQVHNWTYNNASYKVTMIRSVLQRGSGCPWSFDESPGVHLRDIPGAGTAASTCKVEDSFNYLKRDVLVVTRWKVFQKLFWNSVMDHFGHYQKCLKITNYYIRN